MKIYNPQWNRDMNVSNKLASYMKANGYEPWHTGGGCMAWQKDLSKDASANEYLMITYIDVELGTWKDREDPQWLVGRYVWTDTDESWVCCDDALTLARAVELGTQLPQPKTNEQVMISGKAFAQNFEGANLYRVVVHVEGHPDYLVILRADDEWKARTCAMVFYPYDLSGQLVEYEVTEQR